jgi:hypothetical protein
VLALKSVVLQNGEVGRNKREIAQVTSGRYQQAHRMSGAVDILVRDYGGNRYRMRSFWGSTLVPLLLALGFLLDLLLNNIFHMLLIQLAGSLNSILLMLKVLAVHCPETVMNFHQTTDVTLQ